MGLIYVLVSATVVRAISLSVPSPRRTMSSEQIGYKLLIVLFDIVYAIVLITINNSLNCFAKTTDRLFISAARMSHCRYNTVGITRKLNKINNNKKLICH